MKKIGVIFGGTSAEYEVSLKSASAVLKTMGNMPYEVVMIGITQQGEWLLYQEDIELIENDLWFLEASCRALSFDFTGKGFIDKTSSKTIPVDIVFPVLHGGDGENGVIQGLFELMKLPYIGCGVVPSAISMNKMMLHEFAETVGVKSTPSMVVSSSSKNSHQVHEFVEKNKFPLFVKPNEAGSSKGISKVNSESELLRAIDEASQFDTKVILQKEVVGIEIGCSVLGNDDLVLGALDQINLVDGFFDYEEKYQLLTAKIQVPAQLGISLAETIKEQAINLYRSLDCKGLARIDFFLTTEGDILLNEINTMPGFTDHSRFPMMMREIGLSYEDIIEQLIELAGESDDK
ncbi:D-alanine--D-serine ligase [Vagococcus fluvialis]|uniref:D-alanine--D-serine ligase n=1 Tax=Vagococcus fluvialis TaxID=2738 RepID=UPI003B59440D